MIHVISYEDEITAVLDGPVLDVEWLWDDIDAICKELYHNTAFKCNGILQHCAAYKAALSKYAGTEVNSPMECFIAILCKDYDCKILDYKKADCKYHDLRANN